MDNYFVEREETPLDENGEYDYESLYALDLELFNNDINRLLKGEEIDLPTYNFETGKKIYRGNKLRLKESDVLILEGIHALNEDLTNLIPKHQKFKIYIAPQAQINIDDHNPISLTDLRLVRRIVRDFQFRHSSAEETISMWPSVRRGEFRWIYKNQENADYVFNSLLPYELCIMKKYALPVLKQIKSDSPYYITANRLVKFLKYFDDLEDEMVPNNSLMREFIGKSCFKEVN